MSKPAMAATAFNRARRFTFGPRRPPVMKTTPMQGNVLELVGNNPEQRNWKGMAIALLVILAVCGFVILAVVLLSDEESPSMYASVRINDVLDETWKSGLTSNAKWIGDNLVWRDCYGNVRNTSTPTESQIFISNRTLHSSGISDYVISSDMRYALLAYNKRRVNSYSFNASYYIYNIATKARKDLLHENSVDMLQFAGFGPTGSQIIYIFEGDVFYKENAESPARNLTSSGKGGRITNGIANLLYEEQIFKSSVAHWFSPNGRYLAYARFDDAQVGEAYVTSYSKAVKPDYPYVDPFVYPRVETYKYPKAGRLNSLVTVRVVDLRSWTEIQLSRPLVSRKRLGVLHTVTWSRNNEDILVTWSNRSQSIAVTQQCSTMLSTCVDDVLPLKASDSESAGWIPNLNQPHLPSTDRGVFFSIIPRPQGDLGSFRHLVMVNYSAKPPMQTFLTRGLWEVTKLLHYNPNTRSVYYISNEQNVRGRHVFQVSVDTHLRKCLTCDKKNGQTSTIGSSVTPSKIATWPCLYYDAQFGSSSDWLLVHCLGPGAPYSFTAKLNPASAFESDTYYDYVPDIEGPLDDKASEMTVGMNISVSMYSQNYSDVISSMYLYFSIQANGRTLNVKVLSPRNHIGRIPVIFHVGDIGSQNADFRFRLEFPEYTVSRDNILYVFVDGAGSGFVGNKILQSVARQPGVLEVQDIKAVLKSLENLMDIAPKSIGITGRGYGGFLSIFALTEIDKTFKCAIAVSPIVDWNLYSSYASEKVLGNPYLNPRSYEAVNLLKAVDSLSGSNLLVFHGMKDRIVHQQHSVLLQQSAVESKLPLATVQTVYYPQQNHTFSDKDSNENYYKNARIFFRNCLRGEINIASLLEEE